MKLNFAKINRKIRSLLAQIEYQLINFLTFFSKVTCKKPLVIKGNSCEDSANIAFLGSINRDEINYIKSLRNKEKNFDLFFAHVYSENGAEFIFSADKQDVFDTQKEKAFIVDLGNYKVGVEFFDQDKKRFSKRIEILKSLKRLKKGGADISVAYVRGGLFSEDINIKKMIFARWGFDCVIGIGKTIQKRNATVSLNFRGTRTLISMGSLSSLTKKNPRSSVKSALLYGIKIKRYRNKTEIIQEGYVPLKVLYENGRITYVSEVSQNRFERGKRDEQIFVRVQKKMYGIHCWNNIITLKNVFEVLSEEIPEKFKHLAEYSVNKICARTFEVAPGNIFFFRRQFNDKNDKNIEPEFMRNRLIIRTFFKKCLFIFSYKKLPSFIPHVVINDPTEAHIKLMAWYKQKNISAKVIAVTGSIGKTSTKDMLRYVLSEKYKTAASVRNTNVQVKIGMNLQSMPDDCQIYIQEIGGGRPGGASRHSRMVLPEISVITNIGTAHIGNYDSQLDLMKNKLGIIEGMRHAGVLYLNGDDDLLVNAQTEYPTVYYAVNNKNADYYADNIVEGDQKTYFDIVYGNKRTSVVLNVLGEYNVLNAVCAFAIGKHLGMRDSDIRKGIEKFKTAGIRQNTIKVGGLTLFVDCYNASAESVETSLSVLDKMKGTRKIAIIGDITGVGDKQEEINERVGHIINNHNIDYVVCYGNEADNIAKFVKCDGRTAISIKKASELESWINENAKVGDIILFKGSSKVKLDDRIDSCFGLNTADQRYIDEAEAFSAIRNNIKYRIFPEHISIDKYLGKRSYVKIRDTFVGKKVQKIRTKAFSGNNFIEKIVIGANVKHIGSESFVDCANLSEIVISENVLFIGKRAFEGCKNLRKVEIRGKLFFLGAGAFDGCENLEEIIISEENKSAIIRKLSKLSKKISLIKNKN